VAGRFLKRQDNQEVRLLRRTSCPLLHPCLASRLERSLIHLRLHPAIHQDTVIRQDTVTRQDMVTHQGTVTRQDAVRIATSRNRVMQVPGGRKARLGLETRPGTRACE
jgi:hypothetical protein